MLWAGAVGALSLRLDSYQVITVKDEQGKVTERLVPAAEVKPGDILEWVLTAKNTSGKPLKNVALTIPIPPETFYIAGTAKLLRYQLDERELLVHPLFSYDGVRFSPPPLKKKVKMREGDRIVEKEVVVPPEQYTHARWVLPELPPGKEVSVSLRTRVR